MYQVNRMGLYVVLISVLAFLFILPCAFARGDKGSTQLTGWVDEINESFESGDFPSAGWTSTAEAGSVNYTWGKSDFTASEGVYSIWCSAKNLAGAPKRFPNGNYADGMSAWAVIGPINLQYCTAATLDLDVWYLISDSDKLSVLADIGDGWQGVQFSGNSDGWMHLSYDLSQWPGIGNTLNQPDLYLAFKFYSNGATASTGAFVDNVVLKKYFTGWPDLKIDELVFDQKPYVQGETVTGNITVSNNQVNPAPQSNLQLFLSTDAVIDPEQDLLLGMVDVPSLDVGESYTVSGEFQAPITLPPGLYHVGAVIDHNNYIVEEDETNNQLITPNADFILVAFSGWDVMINEDVTIDFPNNGWIRNPGAGNYAWNWSRYKAFQGEFSLWCTGSNANGAPNVYPEYGYAANADSWTIFGPFDLINCQKADLSFVYNQRVIDKNDRVKVLISTGQGWQGFDLGGNTDGWQYKQLDLMSWPGFGSLKNMSNLRVAFNFVSDNFGSGAVGTFIDKVVLRRQFIMPDLVCSVTPTPVSASPGDEISVAYSVTNSGTAATAVESKVDLYWSADAIIDAGDILIVTNAVPVLEVDASATFTATATLPANVPEGPFYVGALVDGANAVQETSESNNTNSAAVTIVIPKPDLTVSVISVQAPAAQSIEVKVKVMNNGDAASPATQVKCSLDGTGISVGMIDVAALNPGASVDVSSTLNLTSALANGSHTFEAVVDADNAVVEKNEENNNASFEFSFISTGINQSMPVDFAMSQNYPNPFNPQTSIGYALPSRSDVRLIISNIHGQAIRILVDKTMEAGAHEVVWDGTNQQGDKVATGVYFYQIHAGNFKEMRKMILVQ